MIMVQPGGTSLPCAASRTPVLGTYDKGRLSSGAACSETAWWAAQERRATAGS